MLIIVAILVFYNEIHNKMNLAELLLLAIALVAIIRASLNYIHTSDTIEKFTSGSGNYNNYMTKSKNNKNHKNNKRVVELMSENSNEYLDTDTSSNFNNIKSDNNASNNASNNSRNNTELNVIDTQAVKKIDSLFEGSNIPIPSNTNSFMNMNMNINMNKNNFNNTNTTSASTTTSPNTTRAITTSNQGQNPGQTPLPNSVAGIDSVFKPQIVIGNNDSIDGGEYGMGWNNMNMAYTSSMQSAPVNRAYKDDGMTFPNTMNPSRNLWSADGSKNTQWTDNLNDYNKGRWNANLYKRPSDYTDYYMPSGYGMSTPSQSNHSQSQSNQSQSNQSQSMTLDENGQSKKLCGAYDDLEMDQAGNLNIKNYSQAKKWVPGYTYVPPVYWDVPQRHTSVCQPNGPNVRKLTGLVDRGLPLNVLELNPDGTQAQNEDEVKLSNVGSILPRFSYQEEPFSKPFI